MHLKELILWLGSSLATLILSLFGLSSSANKIEFGIYDYENQYSNIAKITIQHEFIGWNNYDAQFTVPQLKKIIDNHRQLFITLEPWPINSDVSNSSELFSAINTGKYDPNIKEICSDLNQFGPLLLRWGHEMDLEAGRYTWSGGDPQQYIEAYKHFYLLCHSVAPQIKYVWSPAGNKGLETYYPGNNFVDYVGLSLYYYPEWQALQSDKTSTLKGLFLPKYNLVKKYQKPIIITELGVTGTPEFQTNWLSGLNQMSSFPLVKQVIYFNSIDHPGVWGDKLATPDWRLTRSTLESILNLF